MTMPFDPAAQLGWRPPASKGTPHLGSVEQTPEELAALQALGVGAPGTTPAPQTGSVPISIAPAGGALSADPRQAAVAALTPAPPVTPQAAAQAQLGVPAAPPPPRPAGPGFKMPYGSQAGEHLGAVADVGQADQLTSYAQAEGLQNRALLLDEQRDATAARLAEREADRARRDQVVDQQMRDLDSRISEASSKSYNSGAFFANPGAMLMNIGAALGGGAAARVTGRNDAQATLEKALDRDFNAWKANAENAQNGVREKANLVTQMRAQMGDRDKADLAAEIVHREMAASAIEAQAARSKVPEIQAQGMKSAAEVREKTATIKDRYNALAVQSANAAAARAKAEEKENFERALKVRELNIKEKEASAKGGDQLNQQTGKIASQLESAGIPTAEAAALQARASTEKGGTVINTNPAANYLAAQFPLLFKIAMGDEAAAAHQDFAAFKNAGMKMLSGVAVSDSERPGLEQQFQNAATPQDRVRAINNTLSAIDRQKAAIMAGASPEAQAAYKERFNSQAPITSAEKPKGFTPGVK